MPKKFKCPKCKSRNVMILGDTTKSFSLGKGIVGGALFGAPGAVGGALMGKKGKLNLMCQDCGHRWKQKR